VPFPVSLRLALEQAEDAEGVLALLSRTTTHEVVVLHPGRGRALRARVDPVETTDLPVAEPGRSADPDAPISIRWEGSAFRTTP
jgi:hypothetical protein